MIMMTRHYKYCGDYRLSKNGVFRTYQPLITVCKEYICHTIRPPVIAVSSVYNMHGFDIGVRASGPK